MNIKKTVAAGFIASAVSLAVAGGAGDAQAAGADKEKCFGVVKAGQNDCGAKDGSHSCMGQATLNGSGGEFVALPKGVCEKLVNGSTESFTAKDEGHMDHIDPGTEEGK